MLYTPKISWQAKTFQRAVLAHLQGISPSAGGTPCQLFFKNVFGKKACMFFVYQCFYLHWSRDSVSPICGIFFIPYQRWKLVRSYSYFSIGKIVVLAFLHTLRIIHIWDKVVTKFTVSQLDSDFCHNKHQPTTPNALFMT